MVWPQEDSRLATGGFRVGHRTNRSLAGIERDLCTLRKGFGPISERFRALSPHAEPLHPLKDNFSQSVSSSYLEFPCDFSYLLSPLGVSEFCFCKPMHESSHASRAGARS